ncbi:2-keto-4-pentenoate hydratase, partial [Streptomyces massasporeus]
MRARITPLGTLLALVAGLLTALVTTTPAQAAPLFKAPFPCGQTWTYSHHSAEVRQALDFIRSDGGTTAGTPVLASASGTAYRYSQPSGAGNYIVAYAVQRLHVERGIAAGRRPVGRKIGLTSPAVQRQLGVDRPDFGALFADMAVPEGRPIAPGRLLQPKAEAEVALVLGTDLPHGDPTVADLLRATAFALPALEIVDSRIADWDITIVDTVADNASCGLYVLGGTPVPLDRVDLRAVTMTLAKNGETVSEGTGADCLGSPLTAALWLASTLAGLGDPLRAGDVVLTGDDSIIEVSSAAAVAWQFSARDHAVREAREQRT